MSKDYLRESTEQIKEESKNIRLRRFKANKAAVEAAKELPPERGPFYSNRATRRANKIWQRRDSGASA